ALRCALRTVQVDPAGREALVLGGGGSARATAAALRGSNLTFVVRDRERAPELGELGQVLAWSDPDWPAVLARAAVVVNATPLGRHGEMALPLTASPPTGALIDLVYVRGGTPLVRWGRDRGLACVDGWTILLAQGAASFEAWTGRPAPLEAMRAALLEVAA
ncbi:MAG: shikimate dehydrogenase, partial [Candidatus Dormibacteraeota bacterium]|nr:shikimate dehydrogenase [Candidatus Dormibacteraeota bacterium]